jgi:hypothetical protein
VDHVSLATLVKINDYKAQSNRLGFVIIYFNQSSERNMIDIPGCSEPQLIEIGLWVNEQTLNIVDAVYMDPERKIVQTGLKASRFASPNRLYLQTGMNLERGECKHKCISDTIQILLGCALGFGTIHACSQKQNHCKKWKWWAREINWKACDFRTGLMWTAYLKISIFIPVWLRLGLK